MKRKLFIIGLILINVAVLVAAISFLPAPKNYFYSHAVPLGKFFATKQWSLVFACVLVSGLVSSGAYFIFEAFQRNGREEG